MLIVAGDGKDRRKKEEEVVKLRVSDQGEHSRVSIDCPKQKMGEGRFEAGAEFLVRTNLFQISVDGGEYRLILRTAYLTGLMDKVPLVLSDMEHRHTHTVAVDPVDCIVGASAATSMLLKVIHSPFEP